MKLKFNVVVFYSFFPRATDKSSKKIVIFWNVTPYCVIEVYQLFGGTCCPHLQGRSVEYVLVSYSPYFCLLVMGTAMFIYCTYRSLYRTLIALQSKELFFLGLINVLTEV
jgi:hypothetical protein